MTGARRHGRTGGRRHRGGRLSMPEERRAARAGRDHPGSDRPGELGRDPASRSSCAGWRERAGLDRPIRHPRVQKYGLALAGHYYGVVPTRVQVLGETELSYLDSLSPGGSQRRRARVLLARPLVRRRVTRARAATSAFVRRAEATGTPLFVTTAGRAAPSTRSTPCSTTGSPRRRSSTASSSTSSASGILLLGKSGIGKSECALELVMRGHRLVADDVVRCDWRPPGIVFGQPAELLRHHIEIRGLGVLNIKRALRRDRRARAQAHRPRRPPRRVEGGRGVRPPRRRGALSHHPRHADPRAPRARAARAATWAASSRWRHATSCSAATARTPRSEFLGRLERHLSVQRPSTASRADGAPAPARESAAELRTPAPTPSWSTLIRRPAGPRAPRGSPPCARRQGGR